MENEKKQQIILRVDIPETVLNTYLKTKTLAEIKTFILENGYKYFLDNYKTLGLEPKEFESTW